MRSSRTKVACLVALLAPLGCTTDLDLLVDDGVDDAGPTQAGTPDAAPDDFPPGVMEPPFQEPDPIPDPPGPFAFTVVHGVVDAPRIFLCRSEGGEPVGEPWPSEGLAFGEAWVTDELPGIDIEMDSVQLLVIGGASDLIQGRDCADVLGDPRTGVMLGGTASSLTRTAGAEAFALNDAGLDGGLTDAGADAAATAHPSEAGPAPDAAGSGAGPIDAGTVGAVDAATPEAGVVAPVDAAPPPPPEIRAAFLPIIPAGSLSSQGSYLLTVAGCLGGFTTPEERAVCGSSYSPERPTLRPMLVRMSRQITFGNPSLQFLQGSLSAGTVTVRSVPGELHDGSQITIATDVSAGVIEPYPPLQSVAAVTYGEPLSLVELQLQSEIGATWSDTWGPALDALGIDALEGLRGYTLIFIGPAPWLQTDDPQWWNDPRFTLVRNSPD